MHYGKLILPLWAGALLILSLNLAAIGKEADTTAGIVLSQGQLVKASDLPILSAGQAWGVLQFDKNVQGGPLTIGSRKFTHGLGTHAQSRIVIDLDKTCDRFKAWVGIDGAMKGQAAPSVVFQVLADGKKLFDSGVMRHDNPAKRVDVSVADAMFLELVATEAGDGSSSDHADWAEATFTLTSNRSAVKADDETQYQVSIPGLLVKLNAKGHIVNIELGQKKLQRLLLGQSRIAGCRTEGAINVHTLDGGTIQFTKTLVSQHGHRCQITERFQPLKSSIRWEVEIRGLGEPWTTYLQSTFEYPAVNEVEMWAPWADPQQAFRGGLEAKSSDWSDPLVPQPLKTALLYYGAHSLPWPNPPNGCWPFSGDIICLPMATLLEPQNDTALSFIISPEDVMRELSLQTTSQGKVIFTRSYQRIDSRRPVKFSLDLVPHEADWRGGLQWMTQRYPQFFDPPNPSAHDLAGTSAYSYDLGVDFDSDKLKKMAFRVNWQASFDFPYMGMFLPPVADSETWTRFGSRLDRPGFSGDEMSLAQMHQYAQQMRERGFYVLNYFNVSEFGTEVKWPLPDTATISQADLWKDCNGFLSTMLRPAILQHSGGQPFYTWKGAIVMDCGEPCYQQFLLEQAKRHIDSIPYAAGICIDRGDWLRFYNIRRDDGESWLEDQPARAFVWSWNDLMNKLGPLMHQAGKCIFVNNHDKRLDLMKHVDGIFDEFTYNGAALNLTALLTLRKPALGWTHKEHNLKPNPDDFFQKYLHMGVYPSAPFPGNNHSIRPSEWVDKLYLDYGPLLDALRGKKWVLAPHCVEVQGNAKVNMFQVPSGYVVPVTFGGGAQSVSITVRNVPGLSKETKCTVQHPGEDRWEKLLFQCRGGELLIDVPLVRSCAMVRLEDGIGDPGSNQ